MSNKIKNMSPLNFIDLEIQFLKDKHKDLSLFKMILVSYRCCSALSTLRHDICTAGSTLSPPVEIKPFSQSDRAAGTCSTRLPSVRRHLLQAVNLCWRSFHFLPATERGRAPLLCSLFLYHSTTTTAKC